MDIEITLDALMHGNQLKHTTRSGWRQRGVVDAESVASHSYGVAYAVLVLAPHLSEPLDLGKALAMAVLHDLPEALTTDIPAPAWRLLPPTVKPEVEGQVMVDLLEGVAGGDALLALWGELQNNESVEARLVHDADKIDMYLQALVYEEQTGNRRLAEFWQRPVAFHFAPAQVLYETLVLRRQGGTNPNP